MTDHLGLAITLITVIIISLPSFFSFQLNYGWWQAWSHMEDSGLQLYDDVNVIFPPLFLKITQVVSNISDTRTFSIAVGILRLIALQCTFYLFLKLFFDKLPATIGSFIVAAEQVKLTTFIPDDYHITERLFFIISVFFFYKLIQKTKAHNQLQYLFGTLCSLFMTLLFYTKQNIGLGVMLATIFGYSLFAILVCKNRLSAFIFVLMNIIAITIVGAMLGITMNSLDNILFANDAKGSMFTLTTNFLTVPQNKRHILFATMIAFIVLFIIFQRDVVLALINDLRKYTDLIPNNLKSDFLAWSPSIAAFGGIVLILFLQNLIITIALASCLVGIVCSTQRGAFGHIFLAFPFAGMLYASSMTSAFVFDSAIMLGVIFVCFLFQISMRGNKSLPVSQFLLWLFFTVYSTNLMAQKINVPYGWWGLTVPSISFSTETFDVPELKYTKMDHQMANMLETIEAAINKHSSSNDDVYFFPHMPYLYKIFDKLPPTKNAVQWFDVVSSKSMEDEIGNLERKKPSLLIYFDPPYGTYNGHEKFKKITESPQRKILNWTDSMVVEGEYELVEYFIYDNDKTHENDKFEVRFKNLNKVSPEQITKINSKLLFSELISPSQPRDRYIFQVTTLSDVEPLVEFFGGIFKEDENWYALKIYQKVK